MMCKYDEMNNDLKENIEGIRVVKTFVREDYEQDKFENKSLMPSPVTADVSK